MDKNFASGLEKPGDRKDDIKLELMTAKVSEYFKHWSDLEEKGYLVLQTIKNENGHYGVIVAHRTDEKRPYIALVGDFKEDAQDSALSAVRKIEHITEEEYSNYKDVDILDSKTSINEINAFIDENILNGNYANYDGIECTGLTRGYYIDDLLRVCGASTIAIFKDKNLGLVGYNVLGDSILKTLRESRENADQNDLERYLCDSVLSYLYTKKLEVLSQNAKDMLENKYREVLEELNVDLSVEAGPRYNDKDNTLGYYVRMSHKIYPLMTRGQTNFPDKEWSYYGARDQMKREIKNHEAKLEKIIQTDEKLKYLVGGLAYDLEAGVAVSDLFDSESKSITVYVPSFLTWAQKITSRGDDWESVFRDLKVKYKEAQLYIAKKSEKNEHDGYADVTGMPSSILIGFIDAKSEEERDEIVYESLVKALRFESGHTKIPSYYDDERLAHCMQVAIEREDYETANKIKVWIDSNKK